MTNRHIVTFTTQDGRTVGRSVVDTGAINARGGCEFAEVGAQRARIFAATGVFVIASWKAAR